MTNRAQAKPTNDPKDVIQAQSLLNVTFAAAIVVLGTIAWLVWDDFFVKKPWKSYQHEYVEVVRSFLAEELDAERRAAQDRIDRLRPQLVEARERVSAISASLKKNKDTKGSQIASEIAALDAALADLQGDLSSEWWQKEMASIAAADKYKVEHHKGPTIEQYRTTLDEVRRRVELISAFRSDRTALNNRLPALDRDINELTTFISALTGDLDKLVQTFGALAEYDVDWQQVFVDNGGTNDIIDRCESCHRGTDQSYLDRDKMWGSHLSNDIVSEFLHEYEDYDAGWNYSPMRQRLPQMLNIALANGDTSFFNADYEELAEIADLGGYDGQLVSQEWIEDHPSSKELAELVTLSTAGDLEDMIRSAARESDENIIQKFENIYARSLVFKGNPMLSPEYRENVLVDPTEDELADGAVSARGEHAASYGTDAVAAMGEELYDEYYDEGLYEGGDFWGDLSEPLPETFFASEVMIYLSSEGPWPMSGVSAYPDRFGLTQYDWFNQAVNDPRVQELYRMLYRKLRHHVQEHLLLFTTHPRHGEILADVHAKGEFGCSSCHRGFGVNAKTIDSAHGKMHHWLTPLFRDGYQEAGCQKCHKSEIELTSAKRIQRGKDLYQELGCWGCHAYEGYESEVGEKLVVAKAHRDIQGEYEDAVAQLATAEEQLAPYIGGDQESLMFQGRRQQELGMEAYLALRADLQERAWTAQRKVLDIQQSMGDLSTRLDELDIEHKKRGPSLKDITLKVDEEHKGWIANWIAYPKAFRPSTKMPHFWYGPFAFVDQKRTIEAGGTADQAFEPGKEGNPLYRRLNKQTVDAMKGVIQHIYQSSKVAVDLGRVRDVSSHDLSSADPATGEVLFQDKGCMGCHGAEHDLVKGEVMIPLEIYDEAGEVQSVNYVKQTEWVPAPRYRYRTDNKVDYDGHGNARSNEFIYSYAANLSRIGEKANKDYLVEWVLQPRLRNKHAIMPSFWPVIAGEPDGAKRQELDALISSLQSQLDAASDADAFAIKLELADAKRRRGDIDGDSRALYAEVRDAVNGMGENISERYGVVRRQLTLALTGYQEALDMVSYLLGLKHDAMVGEDGGYDADNPLNGYIGEYSYNDLVFRLSEDVSQYDNAAGMPLHENPEGEFYEELVNVEGFGDFSFMDADYDQYLASRATQRATESLFSLAEEAVRLSAVAQNALIELQNQPEGASASEQATLARRARQAYADFAGKLNEYARAYANARSRMGKNAPGLDTALLQMQNSERLQFLLTGDPAEMSRAELMHRSKLIGFSYASDDEEGADAIRLGLDEKIANVRADLNALAIAPVGSGMLTATLSAIDAGNVSSDTMQTLARYSATLADAADIMEVARRLAFQFESITPAGEGKAFTTYYGCAGCHEIEGMEEEGKIGVELTHEGSKFIQRLDFGLLEKHAVPEDHHTPSSVSWLNRGSLRPYNFQSNGVMTTNTNNPEGLPVVRGGVGFELPAGIAARYRHSKFDYRSRQSWFQGKLHHPRQWDKGRQLRDSGSWFERTRMPLFELNEDDLYSITLFIEGSENMVPWGAGGDALPERYTYNYENTEDTKIDGWWVLRKYNCISCHSIGEREGRYRRLASTLYQPLALEDWNADALGLRTDGATADGINTPPLLYDAGQRIRSEWLVNWLQDPYEVRNMLQANPGAASVKAIMPQFHLTQTEAEKVQAFLAEQAEASQVASDEAGSPTPESIAFGREIFKSASGACLSCHSVAEMKDGYLAPGGKAPNLRNTESRLRKEWVRKWLRNPEAIQPAGRMPIYFQYDIATDRWVLRDASSQGQNLTKVKALGYEGDHIEALIDWLYEELPSLTQAEAEALAAEPVRSPESE